MRVQIKNVVAHLDSFPDLDDVTKDYFKQIKETLYRLDKYLMGLGRIPLPKERQLWRKVFTNPDMLGTPNRVFLDWDQYPYNSNSISCSSFATQSATSWWLTRRLELTQVNTDIFKMVAGTAMHSHRENAIMQHPDANPIISEERFKYYHDKNSKYFLSGAVDSVWFAEDFPILKGLYPDKKWVIEDMKNTGGYGIYMKTSGSLTEQERQCEGFIRQLSLGKYLILKSGKYNVKEEDFANVGIISAYASDWSAPAWTQKVKKPITEIVLPIYSVERMEQILDDELPQWYDLLKVEKITDIPENFRCSPEYKNMYYSSKAGTRMCPDKCNVSEFCPFADPSMAI